MCKKSKKVEAPIEQTANPLENFELKKTEPAYDEEGGRDYFTEYYNAYKNDYIDQYLNAYRKFKEAGNLPDFNPLAQPTTTAQPEEELSDLD